MSLTEAQLKQIIEEEFVNLINEEEIDEKLFDKLKSFSKKFGDLFSKSVSSGRDVRDIGRALARYKVPEKQPQIGQPKQQPQKPEQPEEQPQISPQTGLVRRSSTGLSTDVIGIGSEPVSPEKGTARARVEPRMALPPGERPENNQQQFQPFGSLPPPIEIKKQLLLSEPTKIGVTDKVGELLNDTNSESYKLLFGEIARSFKTSSDFESLNPEQKQQSDDYINTILKSLADNRRILKNATYTVTSETLKEQDKVPSARQIEKDAGVFDSYIVKTLKHSIKQKLNYIPSVIIEFVINLLHEEGRLAISKRMYNSLKHTEDPRLKKLNESKSYKSFYNNWKRYTQIGVKI
jgi:hypothetical protein